MLMKDWRWWEKMFFALAFATISMVLYYMIRLVVLEIKVLGRAL